MPTQQEDYLSYAVERNKKSKKEMEILTLFNLYVNKRENMSQTEQDRFWEKATYDESKERSVFNPSKLLMTI